MYSIYKSIFVTYAFLGVILNLHLGIEHDEFVISHDHTCSIVLYLIECLKLSYT
jgi:hypothetical protein